MSTKLENGIDHEFDWAVYADATFAGLSILIPIPGLDWAFEWYFRRRIPRTIARRQGKRLSNEWLRSLGQDREQGCWDSCLLLPLKLGFIFLKRLSRKILYFLTVKEATDMLGYYWHRAFLLNYAIGVRGIEGEVEAERTRRAMDLVLADTTTSPLSQIAEEMIDSSRHVWRSLRRVRYEDEEDEMLAEQKSMLQRRWAEFDAYFDGLLARYIDAYEQLASEERLVLEGLSEADEVKVGGEAFVVGASMGSAEESTALSGEEE